MRYIHKLPPDGVLVVNAKDPNSQAIKNAPDIFVLGEKNYAERGYKIVEYNKDADNALREKLRSVVRVTGAHNRENALAAYAVGNELCLSQDIILQGLAEFQGIWRRMELVGQFHGDIPIISDYAHHPTAIKATLKAIKETYPVKRLVLAYQPHQHNRTKMLFGRFVEAFDEADVLIMNEIYDVAGRKEKNDETVSSWDLAKAIEARSKNKTVVYTQNLQETKQQIKSLVQPNDIIVIMGAGDIDSIARELVFPDHHLHVYEESRTNHTYT